jgi:hypothetical protein
MTQTFNELESRVDRDLRRLPLPMAPATLLPRVLAAVDAWARRPWYTRAWFTWPLGWQIASIAALALFAVGLWMLPPAPPSFVVTSNASRVLWRTIVEPFLLYAFGIVILMCLACAAFGAALSYVFFERAEQS